MAGEFEGFNNVNNIDKLVNKCINNLILQYKKKLITLTTLKIVKFYFKIIFQTQN